MNDLIVRKEGRVGRLTLNRPKALNALTYEMVLGIAAALDGWEDDPSVAAVVIDAAGDKAFCAGGDLSEMYATATRGDFDYGRRFWRDEYRLNARIAAYPKPYVALMQGFVMGGGVGVSCHGSHRIVCETTRIAMPECGIGLVPDVGGSWLLAHAPGHVGEYLGMTSTRMDASDAIYAGFADRYVPAERWRDVLQTLIETGDCSVIDAVAQDPPDGPLMGERPAIDAAFAGADAGAIRAALGAGGFGEKAAKAIDRNCPLSVACTLELVHRVRALDSVEAALAMEYRFTARSASEGDFVEGIRAMIIDKDKTPRWSHASVADVPAETVAAMLAPVSGGPFD